MSMKRAVIQYVIACMWAMFPVIFCAFSVKAEEALSEHYGNVALGVLFDYPAQWSVAACSPEEVLCTLKIQRRADSGMIAYLTLSAGSLEKAAEDSFFTKEQGKWVLQGRFAPEPALLFTVPAGQALSGTATCGADMTPDATSKRCFFGLVSDGKHAVNIESESNLPEGFDSLRAMLSTIHFIER